MTRPVAVLRESEKDIQHSIAQFLALEGFMVLQYGKPGGHRALAGAVERGHPDVLAIRRGMHVWFEVKRPGGRVSNDQLLMHARLRAAGDPVYVVTSVEDAKRALRQERLSVRSAE